MGSNSAAAASAASGGIAGSTKGQSLPLGRPCFLLQALQRWLTAKSPSKQHARTRVKMTKAANSIFMMKVQSLSTTSQA